MLYSVELASLMSFVCFCHGNTDGCSTICHHPLRGRWRIRTADPLLVRQTLWTSWAKRPHFVSLFFTLVPCVTFGITLLFLAFLPESECKGRDFLANCQMFSTFFFHYFLRYLLNCWLSTKLFFSAVAPFFRNKAIEVHLLHFLVFSFFAA